MLAAHFLFSVSYLYLRKMHCPSGFAVYSMHLRPLLDVEKAGIEYKCKRLYRLQIWTMDSFLQLCGEKSGESCSPDLHLCAAFSSCFPPNSKCAQRKAVIFFNVLHCSICCWWCVSCYFLFLFLDELSRWHNQWDLMGWEMPWSKMP